MNGWMIMFGWVNDKYHEYIVVDDTWINEVDEETTWMIQWDVQIHSKATEPNNTFLPQLLIWYATICTCT